MTATSPITTLRASELLRRLDPRRAAPPRAASRRYAAAAAAWLVALGPTIALQAYIPRAIFVFFWIAVLFSAWYAGLVPAVLAALGAVAAVNYFVVEPRNAFGTIHTTDVITLSIFTLAATMVSVLTARLARARERLAAEAGELAGLARQLQEQAVELEYQTEAAQALAEELELANERLGETAGRAESARAEAEAANRAKSEFLATMSHELRTPINAAMGYVELLEMELRGPVTDEQREDLARIRRSQERLLALVNDVLGFARLETGRVEYTLDDVALHQTLARLEDFVRPQLQAKRIDYEYRPVPDGVRVRADLSRLEQILLNLVSNAVKFTEPGGRIVVDASVEGRAVRVHVRDTGRGIPAEQLERIFEPFVQVERGLTRATDGIGLGLTISRELARGMDAELSVESAVGGGSTFSLTLLRAEG